MKFPNLATHLPRIGFTFLTFFALSSSVREVANVIELINFGFGTLKYEVAIIISSLLFIISIWIMYGFATQLASSLGYTRAKKEGFIITGDGNVIHLGEKDENTSRGKNLEEVLEIKNYEDASPLSALQQSRARILEHISGLRNSSIFNLFIGIAIAAIGISTISTIFFEIEKYSALGNGFDATNFLLLVLLPRLSIALIVQVFSFFFLFMYRSNVQDVRYFQNEITNIDSIAAGVSMIKDKSDQNSKIIINVLMKTERNRIIGKNQKLVGFVDDEDIMKKLMSIDGKISNMTQKSQS